MSTWSTYTCPNCHGIGGYHNLPCSGGLPWQAPAMPIAPYPNVPRYCDEHDVRRIVREELARLKKMEDQ